MLISTCSTSDIRRIGIRAGVDKADDDFGFDEELFEFALGNLFKQQHPTGTI